MLENCQPDSEKGITYTKISKWPKLAEVVTYLSSHSNALLRLCIMVSIKINASFSVASKNLSVTLWKAEIYRAYLTSFKPSHSQAELCAELNGSLPPKEGVSSKSEKTGSQRTGWRCPQVVSLPWWLLQTANAHQGNDHLISCTLV